MNHRSIALPLTALAGLAAAGPVFAQSASTGNWGHHGMMWNGGWFMGPIMMLLFLVIIVAAVVLALRWLAGPGVGPGGDTGPASGRSSSSAKAILEERFARGEIDEEEFRRRKQALEE